MPAPLMKAQRLLLPSLFIASSLLLSLVGCGSSQTRSREPNQGPGDPCYDATVAGQELLSEGMRKRVEDRVMEWHGEIGSEAAKREALEITDEMARLAAAWARVRAAVCAERRNKPTSSNETFIRRADYLAGSNADSFAGDVSASRGCRLARRSGSHGQG